MIRRKKTCRDCLACPVGKGHTLCELGSRIKDVGGTNVFNGQATEHYIPVDYCDKPKTNSKLIFLKKLQENPSGLK